MAGPSQNILPLDVIETIVWGRQKQWGYFRHPPLSGWIGYAAFTLSGEHDWGMYLAAQLCIVCGVFYVYRLGRKWFSEAEAATGALLLYVLFYYTPSSMKFCSHFTVTALMPAMAYYFHRGVTANRLLDWVLFGVASGLACLGKYAAAQLFPACLIVMLLTPEARSRFRAPGFWLALLIFFAMLAPHLHWLMQHDWGPFRHLAERVNGEENPWAWYHPLLALGTLLYPFLPEEAILALAVMPWRPENRLRRQSANRHALAVLLLFSLVPGLIYVLISCCGGNVILMWFSFLASWTGLTVVALSPFKVDGKVFARVWLLLALFVGAMLIGSTIDVLTGTRKRLHADPASFTQAAEDFWFEQTGSRQIPVVFGYRWTAGVIETYLPYHPPACVEDDPENLALLREKIDREGVLIFSDDPARLAQFYQAVGRSAPLTKKVVIPSKAPFGKCRVSCYRLGRLPPAAPLPEKVAKGK